MKIAPAFYAQASDVHTLMALAIRDKAIENLEK